MPHDYEIANRQRAAGLRTVETAGWKGRGKASFNGRGGVNHHTAGSRNGTAPSLNGVIHGHRGSAPGPLCHALQSREPDGNDIFYVIASGVSNHAGKGGWKGLSGNSSVYGLEIEHSGVEPLPEHRQRLAARWHAAMANGRFAPTMVCQHREWAPGRKPDAATHVDPTLFRGWVSQYMGGAPAPGPSPSPSPGPVAAGSILELGMTIVYGPSGAALGVGAGYWQNLDMEGLHYWQSVAGMVTTSVDQRGWDVMRSSALYGAAANPRGESG